MKEKILAEIDRLYKEFRQKAKTEQASEYYLGMADGLDLIEQFIDQIEE